MAAIHTELLPAAMALTRLPKSKIRQTIERLKSAGRIVAGEQGPNSTPLSARDVARILLALASPRAVNAVATEMAVGSLPLFSGDGPRNAEDTLIAVIEAAAFMRSEPFDLAFGEIVVGQTRAELTVWSRDADGTPLSTRYRHSEIPPARDEARSFFHLPLPIVRDIARAILLQ